jgi:hypothetical protein
LATWGHRPKHTSHHSVQTQKHPENVNIIAMATKVEHEKKVCRTQQHVILKYLAGIQLGFF